MRSIGGGANVGGSSILVIFVLLCLTAFATLTMVSASASLRLAERVVAASDAHFAADSRAEEILAQISYIMRNSYENEIESELYRLGAGLTDNIIHYQVPISDALALNIELEINDQGLSITQWRVIIVGDEPIEGTGLPIWPGQ